MWSGNDGAALAICVFFLIPFTGLYVALGGLWGVLWTDLFQFVLKMSIVIAVAYFAVLACGGMQRHAVKFAADTSRAQVRMPPIRLAFFPDFSRGVTAEPLWMVPVASFCVFIGLQWWAFWYPGAEPGGGGYIAQRIFSARDEKQGLLSVLWFNIAHYAIRPWPWIITGLGGHRPVSRTASIPRRGYMMVLNAHLPHQYRGIAIAGFLAAFMSTVATQLNWGASYLVADFYRRFLRKSAPERHYVLVSRLCTVLLVIVSAWVSVAAGIHCVGMAGGAADRRGHGRGLHPALVLVAHQRLERDFGDGVRAAGDGGAESLAAVCRQQLAGVCQRRA